MKKINKYGGFCDVTAPDIRVYRIWYAMLCNDRGLTICDCWHFYSNFERDIKTLSGYENWANKKEYRFTLSPDSKVYSKDTCCFTHRNNIVRNSYSPKILTPEEIEKAYKMWCDGYTQIEIADYFFVSDRTIRRAFKGRKKKNIKENK